MYIYIYWLSLGCFVTLCLVQQTLPHARMKLLVTHSITGGGSIEIEQYFPDHSIHTNHHIPYIPPPPVTSYTFCHSFRILDLHGYSTVVVWVSCYHGNRNKVSQALRWTELLIKS